MFVLYSRFGFKVCFMLIGATVTFITSCLPLLPLIGLITGIQEQLWKNIIFSGNNTLAVKLCYATCMCLLYSTFPGIYAVVAAAVNDAFGPRYYQANFGLLFTTAVAYCLVIICLTKVRQPKMIASSYFFVPLTRFLRCTLYWVIQGCFLSEDFLGPLDF